MEVALQDVIRKQFIGRAINLTRACDSQGFYELLGLLSNHSAHSLIQTDNMAAANYLGMMIDQEVQRFKPWLELAFEHYMLKCRKETRKHSLKKLLKSAHHGLETSNTRMMTYFFFRSALLYSQEMEKGQWAK